MHLLASCCAFVSSRVHPLHVCLSSRFLLYVRSVSCKVFTGMFIFRLPVARSCDSVKRWERYSLSSCVPYCLVRYRIGCEGTAHARIRSTVFLVRFESIPVPGTVLCRCDGYSELFWLFWNIHDPWYFPRWFYTQRFRMPISLVS